MRAWVDPALAGVATLAGLAITVTDDATPYDALTVWAVSLPLLWRRSRPLAAAAALAVGMVVSGIPTFDQTRCGVALPAALLILFALAAREERIRAVAGLGAVLAGTVVLLVTDPQLGTGALFVLPLEAGVWGAGRWARSTSSLAAGLEERSRVLAATREDTTRLAVEVERMRLAGDLDTAARAELEEIVALAEPGGGDRFGRIESQGRDTLGAMRGMLGTLRDERVADPQPTLAQLRPLLERAPVTVVLEVDGAPRPLPAGLELAAFRTVQHAVDALATDGMTVRLRYAPDALEVEVRGRTPAGHAGAAALAAARERVTAHGGTFRSGSDDGGHQWVRSRLPIAVA
jgi:signal transduction histidine kinase